LSRADPLELAARREQEPLHLLTERLAFRVLGHHVRGRH
jgi:hypothetical protein